MKFSIRLILLVCSAENSSKKTDLKNRSSFGLLETGRNVKCHQFVCFGDLNLSELV